jgi:hypothetical protein
MRFVYGRDPARRPRPICQPRPSRCRDRARRRRSCGVRRTASRREALRSARAPIGRRVAAVLRRGHQERGDRADHQRRARSRSRRSTGTSQEGPPGRRLPARCARPYCRARHGAGRNRCSGATLSALSVTTSPPGSSRPPPAAAPSSTPSRSSKTRRALSAWSSPSTASGVTSSSVEPSRTPATNFAPTPPVTS